MFCGWAAAALSQTSVSDGPEPSRITGPIDEAHVVTLVGNVHPMARGEFDDGVVSAETPFDRMVLELEPSAAQRAELDSLLEAQHDARSPLYHQWLTPAEYGARFGASAVDLKRVTAWLSGHGFAVEEIAASGRLVVFSGNAGMVKDTFHTEIHRYLVNGVEHMGNAQDPQIPAALAGVVGGVVSLHDFRRASQSRARTEFSVGLAARPQYTSGSTHYMFPADWATIYDLNPLYSEGTKGRGASIAIVGRSNINLSDVASFRSAAGLTANNPTVILVGANPGLVSGDQDESTLDVEWSGAIAPAATVEFVVGKSTQATDGVDLAAQYIVNHATAPVMSTSYGSCEQDMGSTELAFYNALWEQAASQGMSAFVSSGDSGASGCDLSSAASGTGKGVNGLCSSPYSTCVGGTEFNEGSNTANYWSATNSASYESALSYIPEEVWNESGSDNGSGLWASGGGASLVYAEPSWQKGVSGTSATNGMRAVPDVAMAAAGHDGYIIYENGSFWAISGTSAASPAFAGLMALVVQARGGSGLGNANAGLYPLVNAAHNPFHATPSGNNGVPGVAGFAASGGTYNLATGLGSVDGALLVSAWGTGATSGSADFALTASAASGVVQVGKTGTFTLSVAESGGGKNAVALTSNAPAGVTASISPTSITPGTTATVTIAVGPTAAPGAQTITLTGTDSSGTQNATYALTVTQPPTLALTAAANSVAVVQGKSGTLSLTAAAGGAFTGNISFSVTGLPTGVTAAWSANPIAAESGTSSNKETLTLNVAGAATVVSSAITVTAAGDGLLASQTVTLQVQQAPGITLAVSPALVQMQSLSTATATVTAIPVGGLAAQTSGASISVAAGLPKGFTATISAPALSSNGSIAWTLTLTGNSSAVAGSSTLSLTAQVAAANSGAAFTASANLPMTVTLTPPALTVSAASTALSAVQGKTNLDVISVAGNGTYAGPVSLSVSGLPSGVTAAWSSNPVTMSGEIGSSTLSLISSSAAKVGPATITVTASGDGVSVSKQITMQIAAAPALTIGVASTPLTIVQGKTGTDPISFVGNNTYAGPVSVSISGLPSGVTTEWSSNPVTLSGENGSSTLTLAASSAASVSSSTTTLTATGDGVSASKQITLQVAQPPGMQLTLAASTLSMAHTGSGGITVTVTPLGGLSAAMALTVSGLPIGVTAAFSTASFSAPGGGSATLTFTGGASARAGTAAVTVNVSGASNASSYSASQVLSLTLK
jgi:subtilase family serine protease